MPKAKRKCVWSPIKRQVRLDGQTASQPLGHTSSTQHQRAWLPLQFTQVLSAQSTGPTSSYTQRSWNQCPPLPRWLETRQGPGASQQKPQQWRPQGKGPGLAGRTVAPTCVRPVKVCPTPIWHLLLSKWESKRENPQVIENK